MPASDQSLDYFSAHGLAPTTPTELNASLAIAIEALKRTLPGDARTELTAGERATLEAGGVRLDAPPPERDPRTESVVKYAALLETSLGTKEVAERLGWPESRVRQMIARRTLYSVLHENRRYVLAYQFRPDGSPVANIGRVNAALDPALHPLEVHEWFTEPDAELFDGDDPDAAMSPIQWLESGGSVARLVRLAREH